MKIIIKYLIGIILLFVSPCVSAGISNNPLGFKAEKNPAILKYQNSFDSLSPKNFIFDQYQNKMKSKWEIFIQKPNEIHVNRNTIDIEKNYLDPIQGDNPSPNEDQLAKWSEVNVSILTTLTAIMATALSVATGALAAFVSLLVSSRAAAELKLMEIGSEVRARFNTYDHLFWVTNIDMSIELLEKYRYAFPDERRGDRLWLAFRDLSRKQSESNNINLAEIAVLAHAPRFHAMMCHLAELAIEYLDPNASDRRFDVVNFQGDYLASRAYRSIIFPIGVSHFEEWFNIFVSFERMTSLLIHRCDYIVPEVLEMRGNSDGDYVKKRLSDMITLAKVVSPLAYQADAINKDIIRMNGAVRLAYSRSMKWSLVLAAVIGVAMPIIALIFVQGYLQVLVMYAILVSSIFSTFWAGYNLINVLRASMRVSNDRFAAISAMREYFSAFPFNQGRDLVAGLDIPVLRKELKRLGLRRLARQFEEYENAARSIVEPGEKIYRFLKAEFSTHRFSEIYPSNPLEGGIVLTFEDLAENRTAQHLQRCNGCNVFVEAKFYGRLHQNLSSFSLPLEDSSRSDIINRIVGISELLGSMPELNAWKAAILEVEKTRNALLEELVKYPKTYE